MSIILAIEPDRRQAAHVSAIVRQRVGAELILADTTERALDAIGSQVPDLVLVPALLSPQDDAALNAALRVIAAAAHVRTLTIPVFANGVEREARGGGLLSRWRRGRSEPTLGGCDPAVFAEQISGYLREAAAERAAVARPDVDADERSVETAPVAEGAAAAATATPILESEPILTSAPAIEHEPAIERPMLEFKPTPLPVVDDAPEPVFVASPESVVEAVAPIHVEPAEPIAVGPEQTLSADAIAPAADEVPAAPAPETPAQPAASGFDEPEFEFAPSPELATAPLAQLDAHPIDAPTEESGDADEISDDIVIDLSSDIEEIAPEIESEEELFDGERIGVYTMPSFDEEFRIDDDEPVAARTFSARPRPESVKELEPLEPLDIAEFEDDETLAAFRAIDGPAPIAAAMKPIVEPAAPIAADPVEVTTVVPAVAQRRDDGWVALGLRHVWAWPALEGVDVESKSALATIQEFANALAAPAAPKPAVALPKPHVVAPAPKADHMEWAELIASLRQDIERRRNQPVPPPVARPRPAPAAVRNHEAHPERKSTPVQDEWGFFDPHQCGFAALLEKLDQITDSDDDADGRRPA